MTRQEAIEQLQDMVEKQHILTYKELIKATIEINYDDIENIEPFEDVLSPIEYTYCDRCGNLESSSEACWLDYMDWENENDLKVIKELENEEHNHEPCVICDMCYHELLDKKGK